MITTASKITLVRIFLIPVFVAIAIYYGRSVREGHPEVWMRFTALGVFLTASLSDGLDGYIARKYNQISRLGVILDPIADKGLLLAALLTLSLAGWEYALPIWFLVLCIARDLIMVLGSILLQVHNGSVQIKPSWVGKTATVLQMIAISWTMLQLPFHVWIVATAGLFTLASGAGYIVDGMRQATHPSIP